MKLPVRVIAYRVLYNLRRGIKVGQVVAYPTIDGSSPSDCDWMVPNLRDPYGNEG
jgi:hypothetical protein